MFWKHNLPAFLWALCILSLCGLPGSDLPDLSFWELLTFDKFAHAFVFGLLTLLMIVGFKKQHTLLKLQYFAIPYSLIFGILYGGFIELLQGVVFVGRTASIMDVVANSIGCFSGLLAFFVIYGRLS